MLRSIRRVRRRPPLSSGDVIGAHRMEVRLPVDAVMVKVDFLHQEVMLPGPNPQGPCKSYSAAPTIIAEPLK